MALHIAVTPSLCTCIDVYITHVYIKVQCMAPSFFAARTPSLRRNIDLLMFHELSNDVIVGISECK